MGELIEQYGFPKSQLVVERKLSLFPHIQKGKIPDRRVDIVAMVRGIHPEHLLYPLLLIECKHTDITDSAVEQVIGYNYYMGAYFVGVASRAGFVLGWQEGVKGQYQWKDGLLPYKELRGLVQTYATYPPMA